MMNKIDAIIAAGIGEVTAWYFIYLLDQPGAIEKLGILGGMIWSLAAVFPVLAVLGLWIASLIGKKFLSVYQLAKFLLIGVVATIFDLGILALFIQLSDVTAGIYFSVFKAISFVVATGLKYVPDKLWAFKKNNTSGVTKEFLQFFVVTLIGLGINVYVASFIVNQIGPQFGLPDKLWANLAGIGAVLVTFAWNFVGYKFFVFKK